MGDADHQADALPLRRLWELVATADQRQPFARLPRARRWTFSCLLLPATAEREGLWWEGTRGPHAHAIDLEPCVQSRRTASCYLLYCDSAFHAAAPCTGLWDTLLVGAFVSPCFAIASPVLQPTARSSCLRLDNLWCVLNIRFF